VAFVAVDGEFISSSQRAALVADIGQLPFACRHAGGGDFRAARGTDLRPALPVAIEKRLGRIDKVIPERVKGLFKSSLQADNRPTVPIRLSLFFCIHGSIPYWLQFIVRFIKWP